MSSATILRVVLSLNITKCPPCMQACVGLLKKKGSDQSVWAWEGVVREQGDEQLSPFVLICFFSSPQDVSCNEIATLPPHIGEMESLKELNVRRNHLQQLPDGKIENKYAWKLKNAHACRRGISAFNNDLFLRITQFFSKLKKKKRKKMHWVGILFSPSRGDYFLFTGNCVRLLNLYVAVSLLPSQRSKPVPIFKT